MESKKPLRVGPGQGSRQAYVVLVDKGRPVVRQSLRTDDGRVVWFDMTPEEAHSLRADLHRAVRDIASGGWDDADHPEARF